MSNSPELEILDKSDDQSKSFLQQMRTPNSKQPRNREESVLQEQMAGVGVSSPIVKRRLFQERNSPYRDSEQVQNTIPNTVPLNTIPNTVPLDTLEQPVDFEEEREMFNKEQIKEKKVPPPPSTLKGYTVYKDFYCMLNLTDISYGVKGHNKFYQIQVLCRDEQFYLFTRWGRVGAANPQEQVVPQESRFDAIKAFKRKFADKTHQEWDSRQSFETQPGKYTLINVAAGQGTAQSINQEITRLNSRNALIANKMKSQPSKLEPEIFSLMSLIWDISRMQRTLKSLNFDTEKNPLGRLTEDQISKGLTVLSQIQRVLQSDRYKESALIELSNVFYTNIPQSYGMKKPPMIDTLTEVKKKLDLLTTLKELDIANNYLNVAVKEESNENPLDLFYRLLKSEIRVCKDEEMRKVIEESMRRTHGPTHDKFKLEMLDVYEIDRVGEDVRYYPFRKLGNKRLLWHGSRLTNYVGIIAEGLRVAPSEAPSSGYMFGKGIYFADVCSKSAQYCYHSQDSTDALLLLCEVSLGNMYQVYKAKQLTSAPTHYHSVFGVGRNRCNPDAAYLYNGSVLLERGEVMPSQNQDSDLIYNEYVVYDVAQVRIRYIVKVRFV